MADAERQQLQEITDRGQAAAENSRAAKVDQ
jgi:hypothetical protein